MTGTDTVNATLIILIVSLVVVTVFMVRKLPGATRQGLSAVWTNMSGPTLANDLKQHWPGTDAETAEPDR